MKFLNKCLTDDIFETEEVLKEEVKKCEYWDCPIWMHGYCTTNEFVAQLVCGHKHDDRERTGTL